MTTKPKSVTDLAKAALYRLSELGLPPTPENYAQHYYDILGRHPSAAVEEGEPGEVVDKQLLDEVDQILNSVAQKTSQLAESLNARNEEMRITVGDLSRSEEKGTMMKLLGTILTTTDAILTTTGDAYDGLIVTRQALDQIKTELQETRRLVQEDALTGAQNRRGMEASLHREVSRSHRHGHKLTVSMLDIDHFKKINDKHGHDAGDQVLVHLTTLMRSVLRESDILARYGGEEFLVILPDTDVNGAQFMLDRLQKVVASTPLQYRDKRIPFAFSGGVAQLQPKEKAQPLVIRVDAALYEAKRAGRNCIKIAAN